MTVRIIKGDCREVLKSLEAESVHCVVTSPPYFGLRDYGVAGQIGLEPTPDAFVAEMVEVFREIHRILRADGTAWLNLGDSYSTHAAGKVANPMAKSTLAGVRTQEVANESSRATGAYFKCKSLPEKNLIGVPWRVAFGLQADGWILRQDIIWSKPNPMPESVRDRCTKAHEYIFLLAKSARYHYDADAVREDAVCNKLPGRGMTDTKKNYGPNNGGNAGLKALRNRLVDSGQCDVTRNLRSVWNIPTQAFPGAHFATFPPELIEPCIRAGCPEGGTVLDPFGGAGTTGLVADRLKRNAILIELNPEYAAMAERRINADAPLFADVSS